MPYHIEILAIKEELYPNIKTAADSLNKVQQEFIFSTPPDRLKGSLYLKKRNAYESGDVFQWLRDYRQVSGGNRPYLILLTDGPLSSPVLSNLFGTSSAKEGLAVFTIHNFDQFVNDIIRYARYYFVRYAIAFLQPTLKSHDDPSRKACIFHKKMRKIEIRDSLNSGVICQLCRDILAPMLNPEISEAIDKMLLVVSNQHPYSIIIKGGGVKGLAFAGALLELENHFSFDTFAGTSAGAIAAVLMGAGFKPKELLTALSDKNFSDFKDASLFGSLVNFIKTKGLYPGDEVESWITSLLHQKFPEKLTEVELRELPSHTIVYASRIKNGRLTFDSKKERMNTHAAFAARCSMSIPYFFSPVTVDGIRVYDGGLRSNFPLQEFMTSYPAKPVIGLYLVSGSQKGGAVIGELVNIAIDGEEMAIVESNLDKIVVIDPRPVKTTDFDLSEKKKEFLVLAGRLAALKFIERNYKDIPVDQSKIKQLDLKITQIKKEL